VKNERADESEGEQASERARDGVAGKEGCREARKEGVSQVVSE
jgi:hypothetical protein